MSREEDIGKCLSTIEMLTGKGKKSPKGERYKRLFDLTALVCVYLALLPIWALVWTLIPLLIFLEDKGPVFYRQKRMGRHGKPFLMVKFRTMVPEADRLGPLLTRVNDRRVTRVGRYLRYTHLDELPQAWNVLKGEMSIVGPRPAPVCSYKHDDWGMTEFSRRLAALPGITGLAQVRVDAWATHRNKLRYDLLYIRNMGFWLDLKLIVVSVPIFLRGGPKSAIRRRKHVAYSNPEGRCLKEEQSRE